MKRVGVDELRVGMFIDGVVGSWIGHGLWRTKFLISDDDMLEATRRSGAREFWIDSSRCASVAEVPALGDGPALPMFERTQGEAMVSQPVSSALKAQIQSATLADETVRAARICKLGRETVASLFEDVRLGRAPDVKAAQPLVEDIVGSVSRNATALINLARLKSKDDYTYMHSVSVCALMVALGRQLSADDDMCRRLGFAGLFHDIGKALIPLKILNKPGKLTDEEFRLVKSHSTGGHDMLLNAGITDEVALDVIRHHHEKLDGSGYPDRLAGEEVSLAARMGAVCDVYDAVTSTRPYKAAWDPAEALAQMVSWQGHFDRAVLAAFVKMNGVYPVGSLVRLKSDRLAIVIDNHRDALHSPIVKVFYSKKSRMNVPTEVLDLAKPGATEKIVSREPRGNWSVDLLNNLSKPIA